MIRPREPIPQSIELPADVWDIVLHKVPIEALLSVLMNIFSTSKLLGSVAISWVEKIQEEVHGDAHSDVKPKKFSFYRTVYKRWMTPVHRVPHDGYMNHIYKTKEKHTLDHLSNYLSLLYYIFLYSYSLIDMLRHKVVSSIDDDGGDDDIWKEIGIGLIHYYDPIQKHTIRISHVKNTEQFAIIADDWDWPPLVKDTHASYILKRLESGADILIPEYRHLLRNLVVRVDGKLYSIFSQEATMIRKNCFFYFTSHTLEMATKAFLLCRYSERNANKIFQGDRFLVTS
jgi:hypothetical protein